MTSDILQEDLEKLEVLRTVLPTFIRDNALWKQCYSADQVSWVTKDFHVRCDNKGPTLTIIQLGEYIFGGFVEQSWGGKGLRLSYVFKIRFKVYTYTLLNPLIT